MPTTRVSTLTKGYNRHRHVPPTEVDLAITLTKSGVRHFLHSCCIQALRWMPAPGTGVSIGSSIMQKTDSTLQNRLGHCQVGICGPMRQLVAPNGIGLGTSIGEGITTKIAWPPTFQWPWVCKRARLHPTPYKIQSCCYIEQRGRLFRYTKLQHGLSYLSYQSSLSSQDIICGQSLLT